MSISQPIEQKLANSLSVKSDNELISILETSADWRPEVVAFVESELARRSVSTTQIEQRLIERTEQSTNESHERVNVPLTFWESVFTLLYGGCLGLFGLLFLWPQASRFKSNGYILKSQKSWRLYWTAFGVRTLIVAIVIITNIATK